MVIHCTRLYIRCVRYVLFIRYIRFVRFTRFIGFVGYIRNIGFVVDTEYLPVLYNCQYPHMNPQTYKADSRTRNPSVTHNV